MEEKEISKTFDFELTEDKKSVEILLPLEGIPPTVQDIESAYKSSALSACLFREDLVKQAIVDFTKSKAAHADGQAPNTFRYKVADRKSASLHLEVSSDRLSASLVITSAFGGNNPSEKIILAYLKKQGVVEGIQLQNIRAYCSESCTLAPGVQSTVVVAKGTPAKSGIQCEFNWSVTPFQDRELQPVEREDGTTDMYDLGEIETVSPGDVVMVRTPSRKSDDGVNVFGEFIQSIAPPNIPFEVAEGVEVSETNPNELIATRKGVPMKMKDVVRVDDILVLGTVDLTTGNIEFDGTVMIQGPVRDGLIVDVTGDIHVRDLVESATLKAGGNIVIKQGVLGRKMEGADAHERTSEFSAHMEAGGDIEARYLQYVVIKAGGSVNVRDQLLNCVITDCEELNVGGPMKRSARLIGGSANVRSSVSVGILGSDSYVPSHINLGTDVDKLKAELESIKTQLMDKQDTLARCMIQLDKFTEKGDQKKIDHFSGVIANIRSDAKDLKSRFETMNYNYTDLVQKVSLSVYGESFPGIELKFGKFNTTLYEASKACRFKFTKMGLKKVAFKKR